MTYSGLKITPEIRYYIKKNQITQLEGFYFGAYFKYSGFSSNIFGTYISSSDREYTLNFDAKLRIKTLGLQIGYKLPITKRFDIDFLIAGPGKSWHNYLLKSYAEIPDEFFDDLNEALKNYSIYDLLNSDFQFSAKNRSTKFGMPTFRYAITFGYIF